MDDSNSIKIIFHPEQALKNKELLVIEACCKKKRTATEQFHSELRFQSLPNSSAIIPFKSKLYIIKGRGNMILLVAEHFVCLSYIPSRTYWLLAEKSFISGNYNSSQLKMFLKHEQAFIFHEMYLMRQAGN